MTPKDVVLVGQVPPPVHGQALAIERLVRADFTRVRLHHVPMEYSSSMDQVGRVGLRKIYKLVKLVWRVLRKRFSTSARILYYPPAGPMLVPVLRDVVFLSLVRPFFPVVVFDLHAGGLETMESRLPAPVRGLFRRAYHDATVVIAKYPPESEGTPLAARNLVVVPYGVPDEYPRFAGQEDDHDHFTALYVGLVTESKGVWTFMKALAMLRDRGLDVRGVVVGEFTCEQAELEWNELVRAHGLEGRVRNTGRLVGDAKWREFYRADVFCFPSHYENEAFPIVIVEAMQFRLPVIGTDWRGIPSMIHDGVNGFIVPPKDAEAVAGRIQRLMLDPGLRASFATASRRLYLQKYTIEAHLVAMEEAILNAATG